jgi:ATP-dependent protease HslVU (ClpYQ) peptidase subunit
LQLGAANRRQLVNAIKEIRKYLEKDSSSEAAKILARLAAALAEERAFPLDDLYRLDYDEFQLAIELLKDWRLDRYYAARIKLFDVVLNYVLPDELRES